MIENHRVRKASWKAWLKELPNPKQLCCRQTVEEQQTWLKVGEEGLASLRMKAD